MSPVFGRQRGHRRRHTRPAVRLAASLTIIAGAGISVTVTSGVAVAAPEVANSAAANVAAPAAVSLTATTRIAGDSRLSTAIATSLDQFPTAGSAKAVVLARSDTFPDALAGGPLAAKVGGPLLLISPSGLDTAVQAEIVRVAPKGSTVYILGGTAAIGTAVDTSLTQLGYVPKRVFGKDRYATAVAIADQMGDPATVFEATGLNFPDALAGGPAAIKADGVILLTKGDQQSDATSGYLTAHSGGTRYALGGPAAKADPAATPFVGDDRYWTSADVALHFFPAPVTIGAATGSNFPDALAAGPDLAAKGAPLLLSSSSGALPEAITTHLLYWWRSEQKAFVFGGTKSVGDDVAAQIDALVSARARAEAADTSAQYTGQFGVLTMNTTLLGLVEPETVVVDANSGDATEYAVDQDPTTESASVATRAQLAALPLDNLDDFVTAVNALYASEDADMGITETDPSALLTLNASGILFDPVAPPSVRYETYAALASADAATFVSSGVKDSNGRVGIKIYAPLGSDSTDESELSFIFDPVTLQPLEETILDDQGKVLTRLTVTSLTTTSSMPANPYA